MLDLVACKWRFTASRDAHSQFIKQSIITLHSSSQVRMQTRLKLNKMLQLVKIGLDDYTLIILLDRHPNWLYVSRATVSHQLHP